MLPNDIRSSVRSLRRSPGLSLSIVAMLGISIGANVAVYTLVQRVLLRPFALPRLASLVEVSGLSPAEFDSWKTRGAFERSSMWRWRPVLLTSVPNPDNLSALEVGPDLFDTLGVHAQLGRTFSAKDHQSGADPVVVIADRLWRRALSSAPDIVGRQIVLDGKGYTVIGVMEPEFVFTNVKTEAWMPLPMPVPADAGLKRHFSMIARLKPGENVASAIRQFSSAVVREGEPDARPQLRPFVDQFTKPYRTALLVCWAAVTLVLLIACANAGGLLLTRNIARAREFAVRASLGAGRARIAGQVIAESLLLSTAAALVGIAAGAVLLRIFLNLSPLERAALDPAQVTLSGSALLVAAVVALLAALLCSLVPCAYLLRTDTNELLKASSGAGSAGRITNRMRGLLVAVEVALAIVLVSGAGLMLMSLHHVMNLQLGFTPDQVLTARVPIPPQFKTVETKSLYYTRLLDAVRSVPGVQATGIVTVLPFGGYMVTGGLTTEGRAGVPVDKDPDVLVHLRSISPDYFRAIGIRTLRGIAFDGRDTTTGPGVAIVNQTLARQFWPGQDPVGKHLSTARNPKPKDWLTVVGVVEDTRHRDLLTKPEAELYQPYTQNMAAAQITSLVVRTAGAPLSVAQAIERAVHQFNPDQPVSEVQPMSDVVRHAAAQPRFNATLLSTFAGFALLLALSGIFAVAVYTVVQRTREIAVRSAMGATASDLFRWSLRITLVPVLWGIAAGVVVSMWATRLLQSELVGIQSSDPAVLVSAAAILAAVAVLGAVLPSVRAARTDPATILRAE